MRAMKNDAAARIIESMRSRQKKINPAGGPRRSRRGHGRRPRSLPASRFRETGRHVDRVLRRAG